MAIGSCSYNEDTSDTCSDDNFLTYSWTALWDWDVGNNGFNDAQSCTEEYCIGENCCVQDSEDNLWYYDLVPPKSLECVDGQNVVPCPARIQLSFFNIYNLIVAIVIIAIIYWALNSKKKKPRKKKA